MSEYDETDPEDLARGFRREFKDAVDAALERDGVPEGDTRVIDYIEVKRIRKNPIHDYRVFFR
jgi:hypothetical protein